MKKMFTIADDYATNRTNNEEPIDLDKIVENYLKTIEGNYYWNIEFMSQSSVYNPETSKIFITTTIIVDIKRHSGTVI